MIWMSGLLLLLLLRIEWKPLHRWFGKDDLMDPSHEARVEFWRYHAPLHRARAFFKKSRELTLLGEHSRANAAFKLGEQNWKMAQEAKLYYLGEGYTLDSIVFSHNEGTAE